MFKIVGLILVLILFSSCSQRITVSFPKEGETVSETGGGTITLTINLSQNPKHKLFEPGVENPGTSRDVIVPFIVSGTTDYEEDHNLLNGSITIKEGELSASFSFNYIDDELDEEDETIVITLGMPNNGVVIGEYGTYTVTITDDDVPPRISFAVSSSTASEDDGKALIAISLNNPSGRILTVPFTFSGSAEIGADYSAENYLVIPKKTTFIDFPVTIIDDIFDETDESIEITMENVENAVLGSPYIHTITVQDNDTPSTVNFASDSQIVSEGVGTATVLVGLNRASGLDITVPYTVTGTATLETDHTLASVGSVIIPKGNTSASITFNIIDDSLDEDDETVIITMGTPINATKGNISTSTISITDNDPLPIVNFSSATSEENEADTDKTANITVSLSAASGRDVSVPYTVGGTATSAVDHTLSSGSLLIPAGNTSKNINFTIKGDNGYEGNETIIVTMGTPTNATLGTPATHTLTITDDDSPPYACFTIGSVLEDTGAPNYYGRTLTMLGTLKDPDTLNDIQAYIDTTIPFIVSDITATLDEDYTSPLPRQIIIPSGESYGSYDFTTIGDTEKEGTEPEKSEVFNVIMGDPINAIKGDTTKCNNGSENYVYPAIINDNDWPTCSFERKITNISEWTSEITIRTLLNKEADKDLKVPFKLKGDGRVNRNDFYFKKGELESEVVIKLIDDLEETFIKRVEVKLEETREVSILNPSTHIIKILDNDWQRKLKGLTLWLNTEKNVKIDDNNNVLSWQDLLNEEKEFLGTKNKPHFTLDERSPFGFVGFYNENEALFGTHRVLFNEPIVIYVAARQTTPYISLILNTHQNLFDYYIKPILSRLELFRLFRKDGFFRHEILRCQEKNEGPISEEVVDSFIHAIYDNQFHFAPLEKLGEISELMVFNGPLTEIEHKKVLKYLLIKHSISSKWCKYNELTGT